MSVCAARNAVLASFPAKAVLSKNKVKLIRFQAEKLNDPQVKALLAKHGVRKLPELPEAEYQAFKKEVAAIV